MDHPGEVQAVALSAAGTQLAAICGHLVFVWEVTTGQVTQLDFQLQPNVIPTLRRPATSVKSISTVAFNRDGTRLAAVRGNSAIVWAVDTRQELGRYHSEPNGPAAFSPDIDRLAMAAGKSVSIWDVVTPGSTGKVEKISAGRRKPGSFRLVRGNLGDLSHPAEIKAMAFSPDGVRLATVSGMTARLWGASSRRELVSVKGVGRLATTLAFSPDSTRLATASGGTAQVWDMTGSEIARLERSEDIRAMIFGSDGNCLTTIGGTTARLWDVNDGEVTWTGDVGRVGAAAFGRDAVGHRKARLLRSGQFETAGRCGSTAMPR